MLTGPPSSRPDMVHFVSHMSREIGVMVCGQVLLVSYCKNYNESLDKSKNHYRKQYMCENVEHVFDCKVCVCVWVWGEGSKLIFHGLGLFL